MAVYTPVNESELTEFLATHEVGKLVSYQGISDGIENTNYFVTTDTGEFVLTLFETIGEKDLRWCLDVMAFFAEHDIPCAHPLADANGAYLTTLSDKPAALVQRLSGTSTDDADGSHCSAIGTMLGRMHVAGQSYPVGRPNSRGPSWWIKTAMRVANDISTEDRSLLDAELVFQSGHNEASIPRGVIHADLFRDNALFTGDELTGVIDFYYACEDALLYDLAVTVNDWCTNADGSLDQDRVAALVSGYTTVRPVEVLEKNLWPVMLRAAALRFWLSRLHDLHFPRGGEITTTKDPDEFRRILTCHIEQPQVLP